MIRTVAFIQRRSDKSRADFRDYYENNHAPFASKFIRGLQLYVRNHVLEERSDPSLDDLGVAFDVMMESEFRSRDDLEAIQRIVDSDPEQAIANDEREFMNRESIAYFVSQSPELFGTRPQPGSQPKSIAAMRRNERVSHHEQDAKARDVGIALVSEGLATAAVLDVRGDTDRNQMSVTDVLLHTWWRDCAAAEVAFDMLEERLRIAAPLQCFWVAECGSLNFNYETEYPAPSA